MYEIFEAYPEWVFELTRRRWPGPDNLIGGDGHDKLTGGAGNDLLIGGADNDVYSFRSNTNIGTDTSKNPVKVSIRLISVPRPPSLSESAWREMQSRLSTEITA